MYLDFQRIKLERFDCREAYLLGLEVFRLSKDQT